MSEDSLTEVKESEPRVIKSFETLQGSVYTNRGGKFERFKTITGEHFPPRDLMVFLDINQEQEQRILNVIYRPPGTKGEGVFVVERQPDDSAKIITDRSQVKYPDKLCFGLVKDGKWTMFIPTTLTPTIGYQVYDMGQFVEKDGQAKYAQHLGNPVVKIEYED